MTSRVLDTSAQDFNDEPANIVERGQSNVNKFALNISVQTGEEFSEEFLHEHLKARPVPISKDLGQHHNEKLGSNFSRNEQPAYEDLTGLLGIGRSNSVNRTDMLNNSLLIASTAELESKDYSHVASRYDLEYYTGEQHAGKFLDGSSYEFGAPSATAHPILGEGSPCHHHAHGSGASNASCSEKMKFLCSFGGRIFSRPIDGKFRYVGGETRIVSIRKSISYFELVKKTSLICNQCHTIKYQLPGENFDGLISVSSDEDLRHMIDEYDNLERGSERLRIFLVSANDPGSLCSVDSRTVQQNEADCQYAVAVNGMMTGSLCRTSSRESLSCQASPLGGILERGSPTSHHAFKMRKADSSPNLKLMISTPASQFCYSPPTAANPYLQSAPMSPIPIQNKEPMVSRLKLCEYQQLPDMQENGNLYMMKQLGYENFNHHDYWGYGFYEASGSPQATTSDNQRKNLFEGNQMHGAHHTNYSTTSTTDYVASPLHHQFNKEFMRPLHDKLEGLSKKSIPSQDASVTSQTFDNQVDDLQKITHLLMNSSLQRAEKLKIQVKEPASQRGQPPSEQKEVTRTNNQVTKDENHLTSIRGSRCKGHMESNRYKIKWIDKKIACFSQIDYDQDEIDNDCFINNSMESIAISIQAQTKDFGSNRPASKFSRTSQDSNSKEMHNISESTTSSKVSLPSSVLPPVETRKMNLEEVTVEETLILPPSEKCDSSFSLQRSKSPSTDQTMGKLAMDVSNCDFALCIDPVNNPNIMDEVKGLEQKFCMGRKFENVVVADSEPSFSHNEHDGLKSAVIVEDVTNNLPSNIGLSTTAIAHIENEHSDPTSSSETGTGSIHVPDCEDGWRRNNESISDAAIAEMEAGAYGLQIIKTADLEEIQELGSGTFGTVYHGKWRGTDVAIKRIKKSCLGGRSSEQDRLVKDFWREAHILSKLHHPNVVAFYGIVPDGPEGTLATVTEYMVDGSLRHVLQRKDRTLDRRKRLIIAMGAAFGMEYLHLKNIIHFDLKCDNLLVNLGDPQRPICKVGDFGLSKFKRNTLVTGGIRGTLPWMAPELLNGSNTRVSEKVDVYSFGIAMWEILTGEEPYADMHSGAIIGGIVNNTLRPPIPERCDSEWRNLMEECWSPDPMARPSFTCITDRLRVMSAALQPRRFNRAKRTDFT